MAAIAILPVPSEEIVAPPISNVSAERNAVAIRNTATRSSQHISLDNFKNEQIKDGKTLILLDEVDHLSGGFSKLSNEKMNRNLTDEYNKIKGEF